MRRLLFITATAVFAWTAGTPAAYAQNQAVSNISNRFSPEAVSKLSVLQQVMMWLAVVMTLLVFMTWVRSADWANVDRFFRRQSRNWNVLLFVPFAVCIPVAITMNVFPFVGLASPFLLFLAYVIPFVVYVSKRNADLPYDDKVFTKKHIRRWTAGKLAAIGIKVQAEEKTLDEMGPAVTLVAKGGATERDDQVHLLTARQSPHLSHN